MMLQQHLPYLFGDKILVEPTHTDCEMSKYPMCLRKDEQRGPIRRASQLYETRGVKCGRGALEQYRPFPGKRTQIG